MREGWLDTPAASGSCQCGAVRFSVTPGPAKSTVCHCRMCQRATGNAFAPLLEVPNTRATITGPLATFASSTLAERGFCPTCGTPLFYRTIAGDTVEFMAGSLAPPFRFHPYDNSGTESRVRWLAGLGALPDRVTRLPAPLHSHQTPEPD